MLTAFMQLPEDDRNFQTGQIWLAFQTDLCEIHWICRCSK